MNFRYRRPEKHERGDKSSAFIYTLYEPRRCSLPRRTSLPVRARLASRETLLPVNEQKLADTCSRGASARRSYISARNPRYPPHAAQSTARLGALV